MKKFVLALALMLPMVVFTACEKDKENEPGNGSGNELVGTWMASGENEFIYYQFNADHSGCDWWADQEETSYKYPFTWSTDGNTLTMVYHDDGYDYSYSIQYSISNDQLILTGEYEYKHLILQRVK